VSLPVLSSNPGPAVEALGDQQVDAPHTPKTDREILHEDSNFFCTYPWTTLYLDLRRITFCCWNKYRDYEYSPRLPGLFEMWNSELMVEMRQLSLDGEKDKFCHSFCPFYAHGYRTIARPYEAKDTNATSALEASALLD